MLLGWLAGWKTGRGGVCFAPPGGVGVGAHHYFHGRVVAVWLLCRVCEGCDESTVRDTLVDASHLSHTPHTSFHTRVPSHTTPLASWCAGQAGVGHAGFTHVDTAGV